MDAPTTTNQFMTVAREWGPWIALVVVFVGSQLAMGWFLLSQTQAREKRMGERLDQQADMVSTTLLTALRESAAALNSSALAQQGMAATTQQCMEVLREHNELKRMELELRQKQGAA